MNNEFETSINAQLISLSQLTIEPAVQAREEYLHGETLRRYIAVLKARDIDNKDHPFPPVKVCKWDGRFVLVDGFHRVAAYEAAGWKDIPAEIVEVNTIEDLKWAASQPNLSHGRPLSGKEVREAFRRFVLAKKHFEADPSANPSVIRQRPKPTIMTLGEIGKVFGKTKGTIRNWFQKEFRKEFNRLYAKSVEMEAFTGTPIGPAHAPTAVDLVHMSLGNVVSQVERLGKGDLIEVLGAFRIAAEQVSDALGPDAVSEGLDAWRAEGWEVPSGWSAPPDMSDF